MSDMNIGSLGLNLLKAFEDMLRERSVTRAAHSG
jgi:DNA-binding transcriptional LysR family regulator